MIEKCISCGADIPESMQACPACETAIKKPMEWVQIAFCDWEAKGADGDFRVWKDGRVWKGRYRSNDKTYTFLKNLIKYGLFLKLILPFICLFFMVLTGGNYGS